MVTDKLNKYTLYWLGSEVPMTASKMCEINCVVNRNFWFNRLCILPQEARGVRWPERREGRKTRQKKEKRWIKNRKKRKDADHGKLWWNTRDIQTQQKLGTNVKITALLGYKDLKSFFSFGHCSYSLERTFPGGAGPHTDLTLAFGLGLEHSKLHGESPSTPRIHRVQGPWTLQRIFRISLYQRILCLLSTKCWFWSPWRYNEWQVEPT